MSNSDKKDFKCSSFRLGFIAENCTKQCSECRDFEDSEKNSLREDSSVISAAAFAAERCPGIVKIIKDCRCLCDEKELYDVMVEFARLHVLAKTPEEDIK